MTKSICKFLFNNQIFFGFFSLQLPNMQNCKKLPDSYDTEGNFFFYTCEFHKELYLKFLRI